MTIPMSDITKKSDTELQTLIATARDTIQAERFKDPFSRKAGIIRSAKREIARALTEVTKRRNQPTT